jgi:hypothetical protein
MIVTCCASDKVKYMLPVGGGQGFRINEPGGEKPNPAATYITSGPVDFEELPVDVEDFGKITYPSFLEESS